MEYIPVYNATFMGGQYFFRSDRARLSGNAAVLAAPVMKFNDRWSVIPTVSSSYQGTKGVGDGVGAGTLFQQQMDHRIGVTGIRSLEGTNWRLKPSASYKRQFLKETRDEAWGRGLFDYEKIALGFEGENVYKDPFSVRLGFDVYRVRFPSYISLESQAGVDPQGNPLGRELAPKKVLDSYNFAWTASATRPFPYDDPKVSLQGGYSLLFQTYPDQLLVDARGQYEDKKRFDVQQALSGGVGYPREFSIAGRKTRLDSSVSMSVARTMSNQNTYDAARTKFVEDSYSNWTIGVGPSWNLSWGDFKRPNWLSTSFRWSRTMYSGRLAQDAGGVYLGDKQHQDRYSLGLAYGYPIGPGFYLKAATNFLWTTSNQAYEKTYAYTYRTANYTMGFTWEY